MFWMSKTYFIWKSFFVFFCDKLTNMVGFWSGPHNHSFCKSFKSLLDGLFDSNMVNFFMTKFVEKKTVKKFGGIFTFMLSTKLQLRTAYKLVRHASSCAIPANFITVPFKSNFSLPTRNYKFGSFGYVKIIWFSNFSNFFHHSRPTKICIFVYPIFQNEVSKLFCFDAILYKKSIMLGGKKI
jgi:hypothetical protein